MDKDKNCYAFQCKDDKWRHDLKLKKSSFHFILVWPRMKLDQLDRKLWSISGIGSWICAHTAGLLPLELPPKKKKQKNSKLQNTIPWENG